MKPTSFEIFSTIFFGLAIIHTFLTPKLYRFSENFASKSKEGMPHWKWYHFTSEIVYYLSEVEVVLGLWLIPLIISFGIALGWDTVFRKLTERDYTHALYITVIFVVVGSRPIIYFAEKVLEYIAKIGGDRPGAWWWTILTIGPLLGALLKEPGAMALAALLLTKKFYQYKPRKIFAYATIGLLFVNISVGGMLTPYSSRALFIVASNWDWGIREMFLLFGWKAILGIVCANFIYYLTFRHEFTEGFPNQIPAHVPEENLPKPSIWVTVVHLLFLGAVAATGEYTPVFIGIFILFLGFCKATKFYQTPLHLKSGVLVGFFFASLLIFGELQKWWVQAFLESYEAGAMMGKALLLSAFVDNATVIYISSLITEQSDTIHYAVIAGAMAGGGLTIVANAPNPVGYSVLREGFGGKISFFYLFLGALAPTLVMLFFFWIFPEYTL